MAEMLLLASSLTLSMGMIQVLNGDKGFIIMKTVTPEKIEGEYHMYGPNGGIQFSSEVRDGQCSIMVETTKGKPIVVFKKPESTSMMTVKLGQTKFLIQMNEPRNGLPRYSDYVVPQAFHNLVDSALYQEFI